MIQVVGSLSASRAFQPRRRRHSPSQAGSDQNGTGVSEAQKSLLLLYIVQNRPKGDLTQIF